MEIENTIEDDSGFSEMMLMQMISGYWGTQAMAVAAKLGIPDVLAQRSALTSEQIAKEVNADPDAVYRLLRALATVGIFVEDEEKRFSNSELSDCLRSDSPRSLRQYTIMHGESWHWQAWENLYSGVKHGKSPFEKAHGQPLFEYFESNAGAAQIFNGAMRNFSGQSGIAALRMVDFSKAKIVVDVGGGQGVLLSQILKKYPKVTGVLLERPHVIGEANVKMKEENLSDRCELHGCDFLTKIPKIDADVWILKNCLHDWDDEVSLKVLRNLRNAITQNAKILIVEMIVPDGSEPSPSKFVDLEMLVMTPGGRERTLAEWECLFGKVDLKLNRVLESVAPLSVLEVVCTSSL